MNAKRDLERWLSDFYSGQATNMAPDRVLTSALATIEATPQRRVLTRVPWRFLDVGTYVRLAGAACAVIAVVAVGSALYSGRAPIIGTDASPTPLQTPSSLATSSASPTENTSPSASSLAGPSASPTPRPRGGLVAYARSNSVWVANADGSNARQLLPQGEPVAWTPDGSRLLVQVVPTCFDVGDADCGIALYLVDPSATAETILQSAQSILEDTLCQYPCSGTQGFTFSPDGSRLAFTRSYSDTSDGTVIAILDLATGRVRELESTYATNPRVQCHVSTRCNGRAGAPHWSPDGSRLVFDRQHISPDTDGQWTSAAVFVVDPDGANLRRITPTGFFAIDPSWSPDGTLITFKNTWLGISEDGQSATFGARDIYVIRPDGSGLQQITDDGASARPVWTTDGRIIVATNLDSTAQGLWLMDADGSDPVPIGTSLGELAEAGCMTCLYPLGAPPNGPIYALWQPVANP